MSNAQRRDLDEQLRQTPPTTRSVPVEEMREEFAGLMGAFGVPEGIRRTDAVIGDRPALVVEPADGPDRLGTILYFHGGSYVVGSPATAMVTTAGLVVRTGMRAISLDYRLAPEHPFPAAIEDAVAAYRELLDDGKPPGSVVFAGDSAGGGLTVTACLRARDAGLPMPAALAAFSPVSDQTRSGASVVEKNGVDPFFTPEALAATGEMYTGGEDPRQPLLSPGVVGDLTGLPPMLLQVGTNELLLDDSVLLAARARAAEVDVVLDVVAGVPHVFPAFLDVLDEAGQALDRAALFLTQHLS